MTSIKDVAQRAGVGVATVSRVLNETGYVSVETRKKVQDAMEELNYIPNELARNLLHKKSGIVAIIIPKISHPFFAEFVLYAEEELLKNGYKTMICSTYSEQNYEKEYLNMLNRHIVDGIIAGGHTLALEDYASVSRPVVALDRFLGEHIPTVASDHRIGGRLAAEKMIECGCKCVVQVQGALVVDSPSHERHYEFERVMKKHGVKVYSYEMEWNDFDYGRYEETARDIIKKYPDIDGIFAVDVIAMAFLKQLSRMKKNVPEDVQVVGYDGTYISKVSVPELTVVEQPIPELSRRAVKMVIGMIEGKRYKNKLVLLEPQMRIGESTKNGQK